MSYQSAGEASPGEGHRVTGNSKIVGMPLAVGLVLVHVSSFLMFISSMNGYRKLISGRCEAPALSAHDKFRFASCPGFFEQSLNDAPFKFFLLTIVTLIVSLIALNVAFKSLKLSSLFGTIALGGSAVILIIAVVATNFDYAEAQSENSIQPLIGWSQDRYGVTLTKTEAESLISHTVRSGDSVMSEGKKFEVKNGDKETKYLALKQINAHEYELIDLKNLEEVPVVGAEKTDAADSTESAKE